MCWGISAIQYKSGRWGGGRRLIINNQVTHAGMDEMKLTVLRVRLRPRGFSARVLSTGTEDGPAVGGPASAM
jgi:hypothetical protein